MSCQTVLPKICGYYLYVGENSCNSGDGTDQRVQSLMYMMMLIIKEIF